MCRLLIWRTVSEEALVCPGGSRILHRRGVPHQRASASWQESCYFLCLDRKYTQGGWSKLKRCNTLIDVIIYPGLLFIFTQHNIPGSTMRQKRQKSKRVGFHFAHNIRRQYKDFFSIHFIWLFIQVVGGWGPHSRAQQWKRGGAGVWNWDLWGLNFRSVVQHLNHRATNAFL